MLQGRPLLATTEDARLFVNREEELGQLERSVRRGFNVAIYGERGVGKSSLLHHVEYRERVARPVAYIDATGVEDVGALVDRVRLAVAGRAPAHREAAERVGFALDTFAASAPGAASTWVAEQVRGLGDVKPTLVLIDASTAPDAAYGLFGRLRDELWQLDHRWIVAVDERDWPELQRPPADTFFDITMRLPPLDDNTLVELLASRESGLPGQALAQIAAESSGNPRRALELVRQSLVRERPLSEVLEVRTARKAAAAQIGRPHSILLSELESSSEPLSPSDQQLLERLGWTRERAGQVFRELEEAHLVRSTSERRSRGRPRKLYFPNEQFSP